MKYRPHRELLLDAMREVVELPPTRVALVEYLSKTATFANVPVDFTKLKVSPYGREGRIGWDTHVVTLEGWGVLGFTDGPLDGFDYAPWKPPFKYDRDGSMVLDSNGNFIIDVRGWGYLTSPGGLGLSEEEAAKIQDSLGARLTEIINADAEGRLKLTKP